MQKGGILTRLGYTPSEGINFFFQILLVKFFQLIL